MKPISILDNAIKSFSHTPVFKLSCLYNGKNRTIYAKYEASSPTFSVKGRMAFYMLKRSYELGLVKSSDTIIEVTSGNTGVALCTACGLVGNKAELIMMDDLSDDKKRLIRFLGGSLITVPFAEGGFKKCFEIAKERAKLPGYFYTNQFANPLNVEAHAVLSAPEFMKQIKKNNLPMPEIFVAGVGSGGITMGFSKYFRDNNVPVKVYSLEPTESPVLSDRKKGESEHHRIEGINDNKLPEVFDHSMSDGIVDVEDGDAILMCQMLAKRGMSVGLPSGANIAGILKILDKRPEDNLVAATMFCDSAERYLSGGVISGDEPMKGHYISKGIEIFDVDFFS